MELRQLQREMELLAKRGLLELAATRREIELELKMEKLQLESTRGSSRDSLSSISSPLRAKTKTNKWLIWKVMSSTGLPFMIITVPIAQMRRQTLWHQ